MTVLVVDGASGVGRGDAFVYERQVAAGHRGPVLRREQDRRARPSPTRAAAGRRRRARRRGTRSSPCRRPSATGVDDLRDLIASRMPEGPALYPLDEITDQPMEVRLAEMVREQALRVTREEVPHSVAVVVEEMERTGDLTRIHASIVVERDSQKGILIGHGGETLEDHRDRRAPRDGAAAGNEGVPRPARQGDEGVAARPQGPRPPRLLASAYLSGRRPSAGGTGRPPCRCRPPRRSGSRAGSDRMRPSRSRPCPSR